MNPGPAHATALGDAIETVSTEQQRNLIRQFDHESNFRRLAGPVGMLVTAIAVLLSSFHIYTAGFGLLATLLASIGLYGVMAFVVARRQKELGVRLALGAQPRGVIWLVMREVFVLLALGLAVGIPAAMALGRYVSSQLHGIDARDPSIAIATVVLLFVVSAAAGLIPARRASRIDPILALRAE